ncbi:MAG: NADP-dependent isocitrate dehydrogenase [Thermodesulfobacteriota bacterium]
MVKKTVYYIEGDGIGPEITRAMQLVLDQAVHQAYKGHRELDWQEILAGEKAKQETGEYLPQQTLDTLQQQADVAIKGPLTTPVGEGFRSLNVSLRQIFDLYACIRPVRHFSGLQTPVKHPEQVDMVVFRENTEDVYAGLEWASSTSEAERLISFLREELHADLHSPSGIGIKPISEKCSKRLVRKAVEYALDKNKPSLTLMHKGNIMKFTEGAFMRWGYELLQEEFAGRYVLEEDQPGRQDGLLVKNRIADNMFQQVLTRPSEYSVIATTNLNGDYLSDALAAQVGGLGLAPGANIGDNLALFEPTHGSVPGRAGTDSANPGSLILSGAMLLEHIGWQEAADMVVSGLEKAIASGRVTGDLARMMPAATQVGCQEFSTHICAQI